MSGEPRLVALTAGLSRYNMGSLPAQSQWVRPEAPSFRRRPSPAAASVGSRSHVGRKASLLRLRWIEPQHS